MTPGEIYDTKRKNFKEKTKRYFEFLISKFDFNEPNHLFNEQPNGTITSDRFEYENQNRKIVISNAYHPNDYGFEVNLTDKQTGQTEMIHFVLKEKQDMEQNYLENVAEILKTELKN